MKTLLTKSHPSHASSQRKGRISNRFIPAIAALFFLGLAQPASAVNKFWSAGGVGDWGNASMWNPVGVPTTNDDVFTETTASITLAASTNRQAHDITIGRFGSTQATLNIEGLATLTASGNILLGDRANARGTIVLKNAGTANSPGFLNIAGNLTIGDASGGNGIFSNNGNLTINGSLTIANNGSANYTIDATVKGTGDMTVARNFIIAQNTGSSGQFWSTHTASTVLVEGNATIGDAGTATFNNRGSFTALNASYTTLIFANATNSDVTLVNHPTGKILSGNPSVFTTATLGRSGRLNATNDGNITVRTLTVANLSGSNVTLLNNGTLASSTGGSTTFGHAGNATITNSGNITAPNLLYLAREPAARVTFTNTGNISSSTTHLANNGTLSLTNNGTFTATTLNIAAGNNGNLTLINHGNITANSTINIAEASSGKTYITNYGAISDNATGGATNTLRLASASASSLTLVNHGDFSLNATSEMDIGGWGATTTTSGGTIDITNSPTGNITLKAGLIVFGSSLYSTRPKTLNNSGNFTARGMVYFGQNNSMTVTNTATGNITATSTLGFGEGNESNSTLVNDGNLSAPYLYLANLGQASITNSGSISATSLYLNGNLNKNYYGSTLNNFGNITAANLYLAPAGKAFVDNFGSITATASIHIANYSSTANLTFNNFPGATLTLGNSTLDAVCIGNKDAAKVDFINSGNITVATSLYLGDAPDSAGRRGELTLTNFSPGNITVSGPHLRLGANSTLNNFGNISSSNADLRVDGTLSLFPGSKLHAQTLAIETDGELIINLDETISDTSPANAPIILTHSLSTLTEPLHINVSYLTRTATYPLIAKPAGTTTAFNNYLIIGLPSGASATTQWNADGSLLQLVFNDGSTPPRPTLLTPDHHLIHALAPNYTLTENNTPTTNGTSTHLPVTTINNNTLQLTFTPARPDEYTYEVQQSTDLQTWTTIHTHTGTSTQPITINSTSNTTTTPQQFLRLKVTPTQP